LNSKLFFKNTTRRNYRYGLNLSGIIVRKKINRLFFKKRSRQRRASIALEQFAEKSIAGISDYNDQIYEIASWLNSLNFTKIFEDQDSLKILKKLNTIITGKLFSRKYLDFGSYCNTILRLNILNTLHVYLIREIFEPNPGFSKYEKISKESTDFIKKLALKKRRKLNNKFSYNKKINYLRIYTNKLINKSNKLFKRSKKILFTVGDFSVVYINCLDSLKENIKFLKLNQLGLKKIFSSHKKTLIILKKLRVLTKSLFRIIKAYKENDSNNKEIKSKFSNICKVIFKLIKRTDSLNIKINKQKKYLNKLYKITLSRRKLIVRLFKYLTIIKKKIKIKRKFLLKQLIKNFKKDKNVLSIFNNKRVLDYNFVKAEKLRRKTNEKLNLMLRRSNIKLIYFGLKKRLKSKRLKRVVKFKKLKRFLSLVNFGLLSLKKLKLKKTNKKLKKLKKTNKRVKNLNRVFRLKKFSIFKKKKKKKSNLLQLKKFFKSLKRFLLKKKEKKLKKTNRLNRFAKFKKIKLRNLKGSDFKKLGIQELQSLRGSKKKKSFILVRVGDAIGKSAKRNKRSSKKSKKILSIGLKKKKWNKFKTRKSKIRVNKRLSGKKKKRNKFKRKK